MWNALASIQKGLDEAAGINTTPGGTQGTTTQVKPAVLEPKPPLIPLQDDSEDFNDPALWGEDQNTLETPPENEPPSTLSTEVVNQPENVPDSPTDPGMFERLPSSFPAASLVSSNEQVSDNPAPTKEDHNSAEDQCQQEPEKASSEPESHPAGGTDLPREEMVPKRELEAAKSRFEEAKNRWRKEKQFTQQLQVRITELEVELNTALAVPNSRSDQERALIEEGKELSRNLGLSQEKVHSLESENYKQHQLIEKLEQELDVLKEKETRYREDQKQSTNMETALQEQAKMLQTTMTKLNCENEALRTENADLTKALEQQTDLFQREMREMRERTASSESSLGKELDQLREARRKEILDQDQKLIWMQEELSNAHKRAHEAEARGVEAQRDISALTADLRMQLQAADSRAMVLKNQLEGVEQENSELSRDFTEARRVVSGLEASRAKNTEQLVEAQKIVVQNQKLIEQLRAENLAAQERIAALSTELTKEKLKSEKDIKNLQGDISRLQGELSAKDAELPVARVHSDQHTQKEQYSEVFPASSSTGFSGSTPVGTHNPRLERELVRINLLLSESIKEKAVMTSTIEHLTSHNDELMIMYGEKVEELQMMDEKLSALCGLERKT